MTPISLLPGWGDALVLLQTRIPNSFLLLSREGACARSGQSSLSGPSSLGRRGREDDRDDSSEFPSTSPTTVLPSFPRRGLRKRTEGRTSPGGRAGRTNGIVAPSPVPLAWEGGVSLPALPPGLHLDPDGHGARPSQTSDEVLSFDRRRSVTPTLNGASHSGPSRQWTLPLAVSKAFLALTCPPTRLPAPRSRVR